MSSFVYDNGNLGIGTTNTIYKLNVQGGNILFGGSLTVENQIFTGYRIVGASFEDSVDSLYKIDANSTSRLYSLNVDTKITTSQLSGPLYIKSCGDKQSFYDCYCDPGDYAIGGGAYCSNLTEGTPRLRESNPSPASTQAWRVACASVNDPDGFGPKVAGDDVTVRNIRVVCLNQQ